MSLFWRFVNRGEIKTIKPKKIKILTTNDMDAHGKFYPDYLKRRKKGKEKGKNESAVGTPDVGIHDIWK